MSREVDSCVVLYSPSEIKETTTEVREAQRVKGQRGRRSKGEAGISSSFRFVADLSDVGTRGGCGGAEEGPSAGERSEMILSSDAAKDGMDKHCCCKQRAEDRRHQNRTATKCSKDWG